MADGHSDSQTLDYMKAGGGFNIDQKKAGAGHDRTSS